MQRFFTLSLILAFCSSLLTAQTILNSEGDPVSLTSEHAPTLLSPLTPRGIASTLEAGDAVEGDYFGEVAFSPDGNRVYAANRTTDNITVFNWNTQSIVADIPVGAQPVSLAATSDYLVVACYSSDEVYVIDRTDYSVAAIFPTGTKPAKVVISPDETLAVIGSEETNTAEVVNLTTLQVQTSIPNFPVYLYRFSFNTATPRNSVYWSNFIIAPDNSYIANGGTDDQGIIFYSPSTGQPLDTLTECPNSPQLSFSGDNSKIIAVHYSGKTAYQIDANSLELLQSVTVDDYSMGTTYSAHAVNMDGSKLYMPFGGNQGGMIDFSDSSYVAIPGVGTASWTGVSPDHQYAVNGQFYLSIIDFETNSVLSQNPGRPIAWGAASTAHPRIIAADPLRYEGYYFYDYSNPNILSFNGNLAGGSELEADNSYSVSISPDETRAVVVNSLSQTASIIDLENETLLHIVPLNDSEVYHSVITQDNRYAIIPLRSFNLIGVVDMDTGELVETFYSGGSKPANIIPHPDGTRAFVVNAGGGDAIAALNLDGPNTELDQTFTAGNFGVAWTNYGLRSSFVVHPSGEIALAAASFDDEVHIVDLESYEILQTFEAEGFPLQAAFSSDGAYAIVTLRNTDEIMLLSFDGSNAELEVIIPGVDDATRVSYDPSSERFAICSNAEKSISFFDPDFPGIVEEQAFGDNYTPLVALFDEEGNPFIVLRSGDEAVPHQLVTPDEAVDLVALPIHQMALSPSGNVAAVCHPGTDQVTIYQQEPSRVTTIDMTLPWSYQVAPHPWTDFIQFQQAASFPLTGQEVTVEILDPNGRIVRTETVAPQRFTLERNQLPAGWYLYRIRQDNRIMAVGKIIAQ
jgi:YVTN family beta-propeller protein